MRARHDRRLVQKRLVGLLGVSLILAACSGGAASSAPAASQAAPTQAASAAAPSAAPSEAAKTLEIAYLSFAVANSYDAPMLAAAQAAAAAGNAKLTVFDANLDPAAQTKQLQDAMASGKYDAIITQPLYGAGLVEDVKKAIAAGIAVGNIDQILGADKTTAESQVEGLSANVAFVPSELGRKIGELVVAACADLAPTRATSATSGRSRRPPSTRAQGRVRRGDRGHPEIKVVAEGRVLLHDGPRPEGLAGHARRPPGHHGHRRRRPGHHRRRPGRQGHRGQGPARRLRRRRHRLPGHRQPATRFGTVMQAPATEGRLGTEQLIEAIRTGTPARASTRSRRCPTAASSPRPTSRRSCRSRSGRAESRSRIG